MEGIQRFGAEPVALVYVVFTLESTDFFADSMRVKNKGAGAVKNPPIGRRACSKLLEDEDHGNIFNGNGARLSRSFIVVIFHA
jgi:hypothetical protein